MKCLMYPDGKITRVSDANAAKTINAGQAKYTSKSIYRAYTKDDPTKKTVTDHVEPVKKENTKNKKNKTAVGHTPSEGQAR